MHERENEVVGIGVEDAPLSVYMRQLQALPSIELGRNYKAVFIEGASQKRSGRGMRIHVQPRY